MKYVFNVNPMGKPRMTRRDKWANRECVVRYHQYKDDLKFQANEQEFVLGNAVELVFLVPMPKSWSDKKKNLNVGKSCASKPDIDNMIKAFFDSLTTDDSQIWYIKAAKFWNDEGMIIVMENLNETAEVGDIKLAIAKDKVNDLRKQGIEINTKPEGQA